MNKNSSGILFFCLLGATANAYSAITYQSDDRYIYHSKATPQTMTPTAPYVDFNKDWWAWEAGAFQHSSVTSNSMTGNGRTYAGADAGHYGARGTSEFSVTFGVDQLTDFSLAGNLDTGVFFLGDLFVTLKENGSNIFSQSAWDFGPGINPFSFSGQFSTGNTYQLILHSDTPLSDYYNEAWSFNLATAPASVPVPAAAWLLGSGLLGLIGVARRKAD